MSLVDDVRDFFGGESRRDRRARKRRAEYNAGVRGRESRVKRMREAILRDPEIGDLTQRELVAKLDKIPDFGFFDAVDSVTNEVTDLLNSAREGEGEKFSARKRTQEMFKVLKEQPGLRQVRSSRAAGGVGGGML